MGWLRLLATLPFKLMDGVTVAESDSRARADNSKKNTIAHTNRILHSDAGAERKGSAPEEGVWGYASYWPALLANLVSFMASVKGMKTES